jgi:hypothetical protein
MRKFGGKAGFFQGKRIENPHESWEQDILNGFTTKGLPVLKAK